jgi:hypothetical protein
MSVSHTQQVLWNLIFAEFSNQKLIDSMKIEFKIKKKIESLLSWICVGVQQIFGIT